MKRIIVTTFALLATMTTACGDTITVDDLRNYKETSCACTEAACAVKQVDQMEHIMKNFDVSLMEDEQAGEYVADARKCLREVGGDAFDNALEKMRERIGM